jgi:hypothetical protein
MNIQKLFRHLWFCEVKFWEYVIQETVWNFYRLVLKENKILRRENKIHKRVKAQSFIPHFKLHTAYVTVSELGIGLYM